MRRLAALACAFALGFGAFEGGMRLAGGSEAAPAFQRLFMPDPRIGHRLRPGARTHYATPEFAADIAINGDGVRGEELGPKQPAERRIAILGDSIVLSVQVDLATTFAAQLEARLNAGAASRTRVINGGVQGYGPVEELLFYRHVVARLEPDVVLVMVFVANDAIEAIDSAPKLVAPPDNVAPVSDDATFFARRLVRRSMVLQTVRLRVNEVIDWMRPEAAPSLSRPLGTYAANPPAEIARGLALTRDVLATLAREADARGTRVGLVLVPARLQLNDTDFAHLQASARAAGHELLRDAATTRFADALAPLGLPMLDLLPALRAQPDPAGLFFRENIHFTPRGHAVVAEALATFVGRMLGDRARLSASAAEITNAATARHAAGN